ncbi:MAG: hypothetical protein RL291_512, partial [Pseudomonadota bacterium]
KTSAQPAFSSLMDATRSIVRTPDKGLPGRWLMTPARVINPKAKPPVAERVCAEEAERNGRKRCVRFTNKPASLADVDFEPRLAPPAEDVALFKIVTDFVEGRGVPPELGPNGRHALVYQRLLNEMSAYVVQPAHPALCNGVPYMLDFYAKELAALRTRIKTVEGQRQRFNDALSQRVTALRASNPAAAASGDITPETAIAEAARLLVNKEGAERIDGFSGGLARLQAAKILIIETQRKSAATPVAKPASTGDTPAASETSAPSPQADEPPKITPETFALAVRVLRVAEAGLYARLYAERLQTISDRMDQLLDGLRKNHAAHCLCGGE